MMKESTNMEINRKQPQKKGTEITFKIKSFAQIKNMNTFERFSKQTIVHYYPLVK